MDTWIVSRNPIGLYELHPPVPPTDPSAPPKVRFFWVIFREEVLTPLQTSVFFYKAHIMAGQVRPSPDTLEFAWLTKQEIEGRLQEDVAYWNGVKDMLSNQ